MSESRRAQNRRLEREERADQLAHERPNRPRRPIDPRLRCYGSSYGVHRFQAVNVNGERCCAFCNLTKEAYNAILWEAQRR